MNSANSNTTDQNLSESLQNHAIVSSSLIQPSYISKNILSDEVTESTENLITLDTPNKHTSHPKLDPKLADTQPSIHSSSYMNMAAVAAAFLQQGGFNRHSMNGSHHQPHPFHNMPHQQPPLGPNPFFPPPTHATPHGFGTELSTLVSTSTQNTFASPLSVPLQPHRIPRASPLTSEKSMLDDSGIGGMMSPQNLSTPECATLKNSSGCSSSSSSGGGSSGALKRKYSITSTSPNSTPSTTSSSSASSGNNSTTPTSTMTRTHQYKKFMKPLLERKRRARINKCLDELKEIMTAALTSQGENVSKLEKADILELTVNHLNKMHQARRLMVSTNRNPLEEIHRFQAGYSSCAQEAASFLLSTPGVDVRISQKLLSHLSTNTMGGPRAATPFGQPVHSPLPPSFPMTPPSSHGMSLMPSSNASNLNDFGKEESKHHPNVGAFQQSQLINSSSFQTRLPATAASRRRSSGGASSASGSVLSPRAISSSSLPANSPTSSLVMESHSRSSSFCDNRMGDMFNATMDDKKPVIDYSITNLTPSPSSTSAISPSENSNGKDTSSASLAHLTVSITADTENSDNDEMEDSIGKKRIKTEYHDHGCEKNVNINDSRSSLSDNIPKDNKSNKGIEIKNQVASVVKPEPIRLPNIHHQPQSITDPVWRPF